MLVASGVVGALLGLHMLPLPAVAQQSPVPPERLRGPPAEPKPPVERMRPPSAEPKPPIERMRPSAPEPKAPVERLRPASDDPKPVEYQRGEPAGGTKATAGQRIANEVATPQNVWTGKLVKLARDQKFYSPSGKQYLIHQPDGNLVIYDANGGYRWGIERITPRYGQSNQVDIGAGNIVVRDASSQRIWSALDEVRDPNARISLDADGVLRIHGSAGAVLWASDRASSESPVVTGPGSTTTTGNTGATNPFFSTSALGDVAKGSGTSGGTATGGSTTQATATGLVAGMNQSAHEAGTRPAEGQAAEFPIRPGQTLERGKRYVSPDGSHYMMLGNDGNLVIKAVAGDRYRWGLDQQRGVDFKKIQFVRMMPDGRLVAADSEGNVLWSPVGGDAAPQSYLTLDAEVLKVVSPAPAVTWSSSEGAAALPAAGTRVALPPLTPCVPMSGYAKCRVIDSPRITIHGTNRVSDSAMDFVKAIYSDMTSRLTPAYPKEKLNFVDIVITNGETAAELERLPIIGTNSRQGKRGEESNDWLRGHGGLNNAWITEQMICKTGVKTRGARDKATRTVDQVVHEFAHTMDFRFNRGAVIQRVYAGKGVDPVELFPQTMQAWFGASPNPKQLQDNPTLRDDMATMFSSQNSYSCSDYKP